MKEKGKVLALGFAARASRGHMVLPIAAARCPLPTAYFPLPAARCTLPAAGCILPNNRTHKILN